MVLLVEAARWALSVPRILFKVGARASANKQSTAPSCRPAVSLYCLNICIKDINEFHEESSGISEYFPVFCHKIFGLKTNQHPG